MSIPSITSLNRPDPKPEIHDVFELFLGLGGDPGRLMYRPEGANSLLLGESTGKAPAKLREFAADIRGKNISSTFSNGRGGVRMPLR